MIEVSTTSSKTGVAYDNRGYHPAASAYDRRHELAQALCAGAATQEVQESSRERQRDEQHGAAAGVSAGSRVPSEAGGRGYLPWSRSGVALCQRRSRQPGPVEGDVGDRALPHGGARRACRALREVLA